MSSGSSIVKQRQLAIRRELDRRNIALKVASLDSGIPYATLASYFPSDPAADPAQIPGGAIYDLCGRMPEDILSLLLPDGFAIVRQPSAVDHDEMATAMHRYLEEKSRAHHPESPAGREISECEDDTLRGRLASVKAAA